MVTKIETGEDGIERVQFKDKVNKSSIKEPKLTANYGDYKRIG